ncbi:MAG: hypothetical protein WCF67_20825 [Chitinophagaceae bacterium]
MPYPNPPLTYLGKHNKNEVYYYSLNQHELDSLPRENWVCLAIANEEFDRAFFEEFVIFSATNGLLEFKGQGLQGELLHDLYDEIIVDYELQAEVETDVMTSWYGEGPNELANAFWGCFYANVLPEGIEQDDVKVVCICFDGGDYADLLKKLLEKINEGWVPEDE